LTIVLKEVDMRNDKEIDAIADQKIADAELILSSLGSVHNARYLAGYAVELALKAKIRRHLEIKDLFIKEKINKADVSFPFRTHDLPNLLIYAGLNLKLANALSDDEYYKHWHKVVNWNTNLRYTTQTCELSTAKEFIKSVKYIVQWIRKN